MGHEEHRAEAPPNVGIAVLTVSDTRTAADDASGRFLAEAAAAAGHRVARRGIVPDDAAAIRAAVEAALADPDVDAVLVTGGTGVAPRDVTPEAVAPVVTKRLDGFGEAFRALSFAEIGAAAILSRAFAGTVGGKAVFCLPGSLPAVRLAWERLLDPEIAHIVRELRKDARSEAGGPGGGGLGRRPPG